MIKFKATGVKKALAGFSGLNQAIKPVNLHRVAVIDLLGWVKKNFKVEGGLHENSSLKWKGLSDSTISQRRKRGKDAKILQDHGNLLNKWKPVYTSRLGYLQSKQDYSSVHEFGENKIPVRKIFPEERQGNKIVKEAVQAFIDHSIKQEGLN